VTYETYTAALIPILVGAARALNNVTNTDQDLVSSVAQSAERRARPVSLSFSEVRERSAKEVRDEVVVDYLF
jgi:hypothetical protein